MSVIAEVWPVVADEHGIWLVSGGDAWRSYAVSADSEPHSGLARDRWPAALPVSAELLPAVGNPPPHGAAEAPVPRYIDVLYHGLRHLRFLIDTDASARESLTGYWTEHLGRLSPLLAGMYD